MSDCAADVSGLLDQLVERLTAHTRRPHDRLTCFYLATKTENYPLSLNSFCTKAAGGGATPQAIDELHRTIASLEFPISQALDFEYAVHGVHRALNGLLLDLLHVGPSSSSSSSENGQLLDEATAIESRKCAAASRLTDAELLFTPAQVAYGCVRKTSKGKEICQAWFQAAEGRARTARRRQKDEREAVRAELAEKEKAAEAENAAAAAKRKQSGKAGTNKGEENTEDTPRLSETSRVGEVTDEDLEQRPLGLTLDELEAIAERIRVLLEEAEQRKVTPDHVRDIDRRLKLCQDPEKIPGTKL